MHLKRNKMPKTWPLSRKGTKYLVRPLHNLKAGIPLMIILRDILEVVKNKKEAKKLLGLNKIKVNGKLIREERFPISLFDIISLDEQNFKLILTNKKFNLIKVDEKQAGEKIVKAIGKKILTGGKVQLNLADGRNYLVKEKVNVGDSVIINLNQNKISEVLPFKEASKIIFIAGKHLGEEGVVERIDKKRKIIALKVEGEEINSRLGCLMVIK